MKKFIISIFVLSTLFGNCVFAKVISNEKIDNKKVELASKIITDLQKEMKNYTSKGSGPFVSAIYDKNGNLVVKVANSVVNEHCSNNHAEMNAIKAAEEKLKTYDLAPYDLSLYVTAEPCETDLYLTVMR